jgi:DNA-binding NarL/FixJ family response regulator
MMVPNDPPVFFILDNLPLRSLGFINVLNRLEHSRRPELALSTLGEEESCIDEQINCEMLIYSIIGTCAAESILERIKGIRTLAPDVPMVIFADRTIGHKILSVLNLGDEGFLFVGTNIELALGALSFLFKGGSYVPLAMRPERTHLEQMRQPNECDRPFSCGLGKSKDPDEGSEGSGPGGSSLTARQKAVLELLSRGDSNKVIARRLKMREGTVKVHVRQIMRKFGVTNRTQAAVVCISGAEKAASQD